MREETERTEEAPDTGVAGVALAAILMELELEFPGIIDRAKERLENTHLRSAAISLRGPRMEPKIRRDIEDGIAWLSVAALFAEAALGPRRRRRKRRR